MTKSVYAFECFIWTFKQIANQGSRNSISKLILANQMLKYKKEFQWINKFLSNYDNGLLLWWYIWQWILSAKEATVHPDIGWETCLIVCRCRLASASSGSANRYVDRYSVSVRGMICLLLVGLECSWLWYRLKQHKDSLCIPELSSPSCILKGLTKLVINPITI